MDLKNNKLILEIYGLMKMVLGLSQIVGLTGGYFLLEWILTYPQTSYIYVIDADLLALIYLAVLIRASIHVVVGIGISRIQSWVKAWIIFGWPISMIITIGLGLTFYHDWLEQNFISSFGQMISWIKLILYLGIVVFDYIFVRRQINEFNQGKEIENLGGRLEIQKVGFFAFIIIFFISILLFMGKPVKQGFHQGFYKKSGVQSKAGKKVQVLEERANLVKTIQAPSQKLSIENQGKEISKESLQNPIVKAVIIDTTKENEFSASKQISNQQGEDKKNLPYQNLIGVLAGFCVVIALLIQLNEIYQNKDAQNISLISFLLLSIGSFLLLFYAASTEKFFLTVIGFLALIICVGVIFLKIRYSS